MGDGADRRGGGVNALDKATLLHVCGVLAGLHGRACLDHEQIPMTRDNKLRLAQSHARIAGIREAYTATMNALRAADEVAA